MSVVIFLATFPLRGTRRAHPEAQGNVLPRSRDARQAHLCISEEQEVDVPFLPVLLRLSNIRQVHRHTPEVEEVTAPSLSVCVLPEAEEVAAPSLSVCIRPEVEEVVAPSLSVCVRPEAKEVAAPSLSVCLRLPLARDGDGKRRRSISMRLFWRRKNRNFSRVFCHPSNPNNPCIVSPLQGFRGGMLVLDRPRGHRGTPP